MSDLIWSEIGRLDDQIELYQSKLHIAYSQIERLTNLLKDNNIPVPDLEAEATALEKEEYTKELEDYKGDLSEFRQSKLEYEAIIDKPDAELNEEEKWNRDRFRDPEWAIKHESYLLRNVKKYEGLLVKLNQ